MPLNNIAIIGSTGAIGNALIEQLIASQPQAKINAFSRSRQVFDAANISHYQIDYRDEASIQAAATRAASDAPLDLVIVAIGVLHGDEFMPEKSLRDMSAQKFQQVFEANTITPALLAKFFLPKLNTKQASVFAALSARVGSISDNRLGGWYAYRASKSALNMVIKNAAIEVARRNKQAVVVSLHPGTVDSGLSKPFQRNVPQGKLFTPKFAAEQLLSVISQLSADDSGKCFAWDGTEVPP